MGSITFAPIAIGQHDFVQGYAVMRKTRKIIVMSCYKVIFFRYIMHLIYIFRDVKFGKESFVLSAARDIGKVQSIDVQFKGSGLYLIEVIVYSKVENKR